MDGEGINMEVNLNIKDRITLISILPSTGKITDLVEVMDLVKLIKFSDEERKLVNLEEKDGRITWDISADTPKTYNINFAQVSIIKDTIKKMDDAGSISLNMLDTCLKFSKL